MVLGDWPEPRGFPCVATRGQERGSEAAAGQYSCVGAPGAQQGQSWPGDGGGPPESPEDSEGPHSTHARGPAIGLGTPALHRGPASGRQGARGSEPGGRFPPTLRWTFHLGEKDVQLLPALPSASAWETPCPETGGRCYPPRHPHYNFAHTEVQSR